MFFVSFLISLFLCLIFFHGDFCILFSFILFIIYSLGFLFYSLIQKRRQHLTINQNNKISQTKEQSFLKLWLKQGVFFILGLITALLTISVHLWIKDSNFLKSFRGENQFIGTVTNRENYQQFGTIIDTQKYHKYLFEDVLGNTFLINTNESYPIGNHLFISASLKKLDPLSLFPSGSGNFITQTKNILINLFSQDFWNYEFNYDTWIFMKGIDGTLYEKQSFIINSTDNMGTIHGNKPNINELSAINKIRSKLQQSIIEIYGNNQYAGLLLGLLIGDKSYIPTEQYQTFINSGLVHIIAVSGGNIAMVVILLSFLLKRIPFYIRNCLILLMVIFYAFLCGGDASVVRATIMACLTLFVLFWGREISIRRSLKYACFILLCISPFSLLYDVGFLLSFSAIIGIVLFQNMVQYFRTKHKQNTIYQTTQQKEFGIVIHLKKFLKDFGNNYVVPTIGASLGTAPILLFFMNGVNITGIFLNLFIVPFIPILTIYGFGSLILFAIFPWNLWTNIEIFLMDILFSLSDFGSHYAIFFQSKNLLTKYLFSLWFLILGITFYRFFGNIKPIDLIKQKNNDTKVHNPKSSFSEDDFFENL